MYLAERTVAYYEVEIKLGGFYDQNAVGFTTFHMYPKDEFAGYLENSIAYHGDDGSIYLNGNIVAQLCTFGSYDVIGCGITNFGSVFFTHNGILLNEFATEFEGSVFPIVSLRGKYSSVQFNFEGDFTFNYEDLKERAPNDDYISFVPSVMLDNIFIQAEWVNMFQQFDQIESRNWLKRIIKYIQERERTQSAV